MSRTPESRKSDLRAAWSGAAGLALAALVLTGAAAHAQRTFFISESTDYSGNGCPNLGDVNTVTKTMRDALVTSSSYGSAWTGTRLVNAFTYPQDFIEGCSTSHPGWGGLDYAYGDSATLTVFAGHGATGAMFWGYPHNNACVIDFSVNMRLGSMAGAKTGYAMWLNCEALSMSNLPYDANFQWVRQHLGFQNVVAIRDNEPRDFVNRTRSGLSGLSNATAWLEVMDGNGQDGNRRKPIVVSYGATSAECWGVHDIARLRAEQILSPRGNGPACEQPNPSFYYCIDYRD